ncbi:hypothetical protein C8J57DRAFT_1656831 [Mycena rebaudengoi]|nr:hypothetical protein C8J57DRAFT_1656831 [Mycena rebaudengoi]
MGISLVQHEALKTAATRLWNEKDFTLFQTEAVMTSVFGTDRSQPDAQLWVAYWAAMSCVYEAIDNDKEYTLPKLPPSPAAATDEDIEMLSATPPELSNTTLSSDAADRARERELRKNNGNQHGELAHRFAPDQGQSTPAETLPAAAKRTGVATKWTDEDAEWDAASW